MGKIFPCIAFIHVIALLPIFLVYTCVPFLIVPLISPFHHGQITAALSPLFNVWIMKKPYYRKNARLLWLMIWCTSVNGRRVVTIVGWRLSNTMGISTSILNTAMLLVIITIYDISSMEETLASTPGLSEYCNSWWWYWRSRCGFVWETLVGMRIMTIMELRGAWCGN